jgi:hypothetical protein
MKAEPRGNCDVVNPNAQPEGADRVGSGDWLGHSINISNELSIKELAKNLSSRQLRNNAAIE